MDPMTPRRIRRLDFSGTDKELQNLLVTFGLKVPSDPSSTWLQITPYESGKRGISLVPSLYLSRNSRSLILRVPGKVKRGNE